MSDAEKRLNSALGFAMKAGKVRSGELPAEKALKSGKAKLVVIDCGISQQSRSRWQAVCGSHGIPMIEVSELGRAIGKDAHMVACIVDNGFANLAMQAYKILDPNFGGMVNGKE